MGRAATATRPLTPLAQRYRNVIALPSCHYDGVYGRAVREVLAVARPAVIALEVPPCLLPELEWAATMWPAPVASVAQGVTLPCVPGDSIFEAFRAGRDAGIPVEAVDVDLAADGRHPGIALPGPELAGRAGPGFAAVSSALAARAPRSASDLAREATMARHLQALMLRFDLVLWVGGLAHWDRIVERLEAGNLEAPHVPAAAERKFRRAALAASALYRLTGQYPWIVQKFAERPERFEAVDAGLSLLHEAARSPGDGVHLDKSDVGSVRGVMDVARTANYARNLAAARGLREMPALGELLLAAKATVADAYAVRVHRLAMRDQAADLVRHLPALTWETSRNGRRAGYRLNGRWLTLEAWHPADREALSIPDIAEIERASRDAHYEKLPGPCAGERFHWGAYPPDEAAWEEFVRYLLRRASVTDEDEPRSLPFSRGMLDGLDVRATVRHWHEDVLYVREARRAKMRFTNGVIDWTSGSERAPVLWDRDEGAGGGWNDPDSPHVGSCSREVVPQQRLYSSGDALATLRHREWSVITLDCPTYVEQQKGHTTFWNAVIEQLLEVQGTDADNVYTWFETMCSFCAGKPLVYYSRYVPGSELQAVARRNRVRLVWSPIERVPAPLLARHRTFRQLHLTASQWRELRRRLARGRSGSRGAVPSA